MYQGKRNNTKTITLADRLQNVNGKTFAAVVLFVIMGLLWARVLLRGEKHPVPANAQTAQQIAQPVQPAEKSFKLVPVKLPVCEGRNDVWAADIFSPARGKLFKTGKEDAPKQTLPEDTGRQRHLANLKKIAAELKVEAVIRDADGNPFQVFINDEILAAGSVLAVKEGPQVYELVLKTIGENEAVFVWDEFTITLDMAETVEK